MKYRAPKPSTHFMGSLIAGDTYQNGVQLTPSATGVDAVVQAVGDDTDINLDLRGKGSGTVLIGGLPVSGGATAYVTPLQYGAIQDGSSHPLSQYYASLAAAQAVYPHATALTDETDWAAVQKAVNYVTTQGGGQVQFDAKYYLINKPIMVLDSSKVALIGVGNRTQLAWNGTSGEGVIVLRNSSQSVVKDINVKVLSGKTVTNGVLVTATGSTQATSLWNVYVNSDGTMTNGFGIGSDTAMDVAFTSLFHCTATGATHSGFRFGNGTTGNVLNTRGFGCLSTNNLYGVTFDGCGGSWYGWGCDTNSGADFKRIQASFDPIIVDGGRSEGSLRFWDTTGGNVAQQIVLRGVACDQFTDAAGLVVNHASQAPLLIENSTFRGGPVDVTMVFGAGGLPSFLSQVTAINVATTGTPFGTGNPSDLKLRCINCFRINSSGEPILESTIDTFVDRIRGTAEDLELTGSGMIAANAQPAYQIRDAGGTVRTVLYKDSSNVLRLQQAAAAAMVIKPASGNVVVFRNNAETLNMVTIFDSANVTIGTNTDGNYKLDLARSGSSGTLRAYDSTASTGVTTVNIREGAGQSTAVPFSVFANDGTTVRMQVTPTAVRMNGSIGFNATPVATQLLATGAGATVDQVITALQTLGLLRQS